MTLILVADDSPVQLLTSRHILSNEGFDVVTAEDGLNAWNLLLETPVDLLVSDIRMPIMDGFELLDTVRASNEFISLPVVLVTGLTLEEDDLMIKANGASAVLAKPVAFKLLVDTVHQLLSQERNHRDMDSGNPTGVNELPSDPSGHKK